MVVSSGIYTVMFNMFNIEINMSLDNVRMPLWDSVFSKVIKETQK